MIAALAVWVKTQPRMLANGRRPWWARNCAIIWVSVTAASASSVAPAHQYGVAVGELPDAASSGVADRFTGAVPAELVEALA